MVADLIEPGELTELLRLLVSTPSVTGEEATVAEAAAGWLRARCVEAQVVEAAPGRPNVIASIGSGPRGLVLNGHYDVVPVGEGWTRDPWGAEIADGRLYGRGSADMKAGVACAMAAFVACARAVPNPQARLLLTLVIDEEDAGRGTRASIAAGLDCDWAVVCEPTELRAVRAARGNCYLDVTIAGVSAHAGNPDLGVNAIHAGAQVVERVVALDRELQTRTHPVLIPPRTGVGVIEGGLLVSAVAPDCAIRIDRRTLPGEDGASALADLERVLAASPIEPHDAQVTVEMTMEMPPFETPAGHPLLTALAAAAEEAGAPAGDPIGVTYATDAGFIDRDGQIPVVVFGPGSVTEAHRPDESVPLADLPIAARTYALLAHRVLTGAV
jgi:acetylornithine deacetylase